MKRLLLLTLVLAGCGKSEPPAIEGNSADTTPKKPVPPAASDWITYHGDSTLTGVAKTTVPDAPVRLWRFKTGDAVEMTPVSADGRIFATSLKGELIALDLKGKELWRKKLEKKNDAYSSPPFATEGLVIVGSEEGTLYAYEAATGEQKWDYFVDDLVQGTPNRVDLKNGKIGVVVIAQADGSLHCVDLHTGKGVWKTDPLERCDGSASVGSGQIIMGSCASALHVFSAGNAKRTADVELGGEAQVAGGVALVGNLAYAGTRAGKVFAVDVREKKILWENVDSKRETFATPAVDDKHVIIGSDDGKVRALDRATGKKIWEFDTEGTPTSAVIAGDRVVVGADGELFILELKTGKQVWMTEVSDKVTSPAVFSGMIVVGTDDGTLTAFGANNK